MILIPFISPSISMKSRIKHLLQFWSLSTRKHNIDALCKKFDNELFSTIKCVVLILTMTGCSDLLIIAKGIEEQGVLEKMTAKT